MLIFTINLQFISQFLYRMRQKGPHAAKNTNLLLYSMQTSWRFLRYFSDIATFFGRHLGEGTKFWRLSLYSPSANFWKIWTFSAQL